MITDPSSDNRIASIAFYAMIKLDEFNPSSDNSHIYKWVNIKEIPLLPFDHSRKLTDGIKRIKERAHVKPLIFKLLPKKFTLNQLQNVFEKVYDMQFDNRNFRRNILNLSYLEELDEYEQHVSRRPGKLYVFNEVKFNEVNEKLFLI